MPATASPASCQAQESLVSQDAACRQSLRNVQIDPATLHIAVWITWRAQAPGLGTRCGRACPRARSGDKMGDVASARLRGEPWLVLGRRGGDLLLDSRGGSCRRTVWPRVACSAMLLKSDATPDSTSIQIDRRHAPWPCSHRLLGMYPLVPAGPVARPAASGRGGSTKFPTKEPHFPAFFWLRSGVSTRSVLASGKTPRRQTHDCRLPLRR